VTAFAFEPTGQLQPSATKVIFKRLRGHGKETNRVALVRGDFAI